MPRNQVVVADNNNNASISGSFTAGSIIRSGGLATQFLMANGSVSTNPGWITGYTETDTLATVTARGASTSTTLSLARVITTGLYGPSTSGNIPIWQYDASNTGFGIVYFESSPDLLRIDVSGQALSGTPDFLIGPDYAQVNGNTVWHAGNLTNLNQLTNGPGYITQSTGDGRYLLGTTSPSTPGNFTLSIGNNGSYSYVQSHSSQPLELNPVGNTVRIAGNVVWHQGNLTNLNQLTNGPGYITQTNALQPIYGDAGAFNLNTSGQHAWIRYSTGAWVNPPTAGNYSHVLSFNLASDNRTVQVYLGDVPGYIWWRPNQGGTQHPWERILTSNNFSSVIGSFLPLAGGTMSGDIILPNDTSVALRNAAGNAGFRPDDQWGNTYTWNTSGGYYVDATSYFLRNSTGSTNWLTISGGNGSFSGTISASNISTGVNASHIVQRDGNGYIYANHVNFNTSESENPSISSFITSNGDGWSRKSSLQHVRNQLGNYGNWITASALSSYLPLSGGTITSRTYLHQAGGGGGENLFTGVDGPTSANGRAQFILASAYSDLVIASSQANGSHGSTLTFATYNPGNSGDYRKFVINQGNWGARAGFLDFGFADAGGRSNPHANINATDDVMSLDGYNKRIGVNQMNPGYNLDVSGNMRTTGRYFSNEWIQMDNHSGLYSPLNGAHFYPNNGTYGSWRSAGNRNGWNGIEFDASNGQVVLMVNPSSNTTGFHNNSYGWQFYWEGGTMYVGKNSYGGNMATVLDSSNFGTWAAPRAYVHSSYVDFYIYGDQNTYYPVTIHNWNNSHGFQRYSIHRGYGWTAPWNPIGTGSHMGGLTFTFDWAGDIAWGGNDKSIRVIEFDETYTSMVAGMQLAHCEGVVVWLRGGGSGGAHYRLHGPGGLSQTYSINMSSWTSCAGVTYSPRSHDVNTVNSEIRSRYPVRGSGSGDIFVNNQAVIHSGNIGSQSVSYASSAGNADTVDGYHASNFLGYFGNSYYQANTWIQLNGVHGLYAPSYNSAHWMPNTNSSYTTWRIAGSRNGYSGIHDDHSSVQMVMFDGSGNGGTYREANGRWYWYYHLSNDCMGIGTSSTNSSYSIYSNKGHGVYYSGNNAAGFDAIHSGSINGGSTVQGLTLQWQGYGATYVIAYKQGELSPSDMAHVYSVGGFYFKIFDGSSNRFHRWDDNGSVSINSSSQGSYTFNVTGDIYATADVIAFSDVRVKEDVRTVENALDKVTKLRGVTYIKKDEENKKRKMGVIAQEVLEVLPEVVHEDNDGYYGVSYGNIVGVLIEAIKEQQKQIDELKQELKNK